VKRLRALAQNLLLAVLALALVVALCEAALRLFPRLLPKGTYSAGHYREDLMSSVYDDTVVYNKVRFVRREPNSEGFLDVEHAPARPRGVRRVGIFGDSYVESVQVPLDQVFYRLVQERLGADRVELLGFGMSGWGTLHSFIAYEKLASRYDLDAAVYVFVENDLGDNALEVQGVSTFRLTPKVYATLSPFPPGYELVLRNPTEQLGATYHVSKWVQERLMLARLVWSRSGLLLDLGVALHRDEAQEQMATRAGAVPNQNDLPSTWPAEYSERARELGERILRRWRDQAKLTNRALFVLYVPRGEAQLRDEKAAADTWYPWLEATTRKLDIPLLDPSDALRRKLDSGEAVYDDHWTPAGHLAVAEMLTERLDEWLESGGRATR
jgi:hypothetical protein